jgi:PAS domain S-box-containing protein
MAGVIMILHVDGDSQIRATTTEALETSDNRFEVHATESTDGARDMLETASVDCIVSECEVAGADGFDFLRSVRQEYPNLPFLLFTNRDGPEIAGKALSAGATDYVQKGPEQYTILAKRVENAVTKYRAEKRYEEEKRRREQMLDRFFDGYVAFDEELRFTEVNESATAFLGRPPEEILGRRYDDIQVESGGETFYEAYQRALETGEPQVVEAPSGVKADRRVEARIYPTDDGLSVYFRDITEQTAYERELEEKNERLKQFTRIVSHDLRNPLNVAQLRLELAMDDCDSPHLEDVEAAHERMETIVEETLILSRQDERITERKPLDLAKSVEGWWSSVATKNAELVVTDPPRVRADPDRLRHVFENLFRNAVVHAGKSAIVEVGALDDGFYIADDGPGVSEDVKDELFEFGVTSTNGGTGYGLAIVKEIIEAHGWEIDIAENSGDVPPNATETGYTLTGACFAVTDVDLVGQS